MTEIHLSFDDDDHREAVLDRLRRVPELVEDDEGARLSFDAEDPNAAWAAARVRMLGALNGTDPTRTASDSRPATAGSEFSAPLFETATPEGGMDREWFLRSL